MQYQNHNEGLPLQKRDVERRVRLRGIAFGLLFVLPIWIGVLFYIFG